MRRFLSIAAASLLVVCGAYAAPDQEPSGVPPEPAEAILRAGNVTWTDDGPRGWEVTAEDGNVVFRTLQIGSQQKVRQVVEDYVAAALAGRTGDAAALAEPGQSTESKNTIESFRKVLDVKSLETDSVRIAAKDGRALVVSKPLTLKEPNPDGQDTGRLVFTLAQSEGKWLVRDVDFESEATAADEIERFEKEHPDAKQVEAAPAQDVGLPYPPTPKYIASQEVIVSWSEKGDAIWGFSKNTGQWTRQEIQPAAEDELVPVVGGSVAGLQVGGAIYAYSGQTGRWDILRLSGDRKLQMSVDSDMVLVMDEQSIYTFADSTGRWSSPDAAATETAADGRPSGQLSIMYLVHADAQSVSAILGQLFRDVVIAPEQRLNAIIVSGSPEDVSKLEAVAMKLDQPTPDPTPGPSPLYPSHPATRQGPPAYTPPQPAALRQKYDGLEQQAARLAGQYRDLATKATRSPGDAEALKEQLADVVQEAFEARQELQRAELGELRRRLGRIEEQIAARQRIKDAITGRRVEELLNPELRWEPDAQSVDVDRAGSSDAKSQPEAAGSEQPTSATDSTLDTARQLETQRAALQQTYGPQHPKIREIEARLESLRGHQAAASLPSPSSLILRSAEEFGRSRSEAEAELKRLTELKEKGFATAAAVESARRNLAMLRDEYAAQIRLLELELEEAVNAREAAAEHCEVLARLHKAGGASQSEVLESTRAVRTAELRIERVHTLLDLYRKVGQTDPLEPSGPASEAQKR